MTRQLALSIVVLSAFLPIGAVHADAPQSPAAESIAVHAPARTTLLNVGDAVPTFSATTHDGHTLSIAPGARRDILVVYFYPRDETPG